MEEYFKHLTGYSIKQLASSEPRPSLHPIPGSRPLTIGAAVLPPLLYYIALLLLPPPPPPTIASLPVKLLRSVLAFIAAVLFLRLPLAYHVPQSIGLTYQLGLVGIYGATRVVDVFFISAYCFGHVPKRVSYLHTRRTETPLSDDTDTKQRDWTDGGVKDPYHHIDSANDILRSSSSGSAATTPLTRSRGKLKEKTNGTIDSTAPLGITSSIHTSDAKDSSIYARRQSTTMESAGYFFYKSLSGPRPTPVTEHAITEPGWPDTVVDRASWALELELSMRGQGFTWTTADVRHTRNTWYPTVMNRVHSILVHVLPVQLGAWLIISTVYKHYLAGVVESSSYHPFDTDKPSPMAYHATRKGELFDSLPMPIQLILTVALGAFLMSAFSLGHSIFAVMLHPLGPHPLAFFPPLYTTRVWDITSVRKFWSFGWHRLFARLFLVWGVWPGEWLERKLLSKPRDQPADIGKVIGAFGSSAIVHAFSVRCVMAGRWSDASGEMRFFLLNGVAVVLEGAIQRLVRNARKRQGWPQYMWYDSWIGRIWWMAAVAWTGREFARGWVKSGLVREMALR